MPREDDNLAEALKLCLRAREELGGQASFRLRTLMDMALVELGKEMARLDRAGPDRETNPEADSGSRARTTATRPVPD